MENQQPISYQWATDATFTMTGTEFGLFYNFIQGLLADPAFRQSTNKVESVLNIVALGEVSSRLLHTAITNGTAKLKEDE